MTRRRVNRPSWKARARKLELDLAEREKTLAAFRAEHQEDLDEKRKLREARDAAQQRAAEAQVIHRETVEMLSLMSAAMAVAQRLPEALQQISGRIDRTHPVEAAALAHLAAQLDERVKPTQAPRPPRAPATPQTSAR